MSSLSGLWTARANAADTPPLLRSVVAKARPALVPVSIGRIGSPASSPTRSDSRPDRRLIDGKAIVLLDADGRPSFQVLQGVLRLIERMDFTAAPGRGDGGEPGPRNPRIPRGWTLSHSPFNAAPTEEELWRIRSHDFH